jgi:hypothetical protein
MMSKIGTGLAVVVCLLFAVNLVTVLAADDEPTRSVTERRAAAAERAEAQAEAALPGQCREWNHTMSPAWNKVQTRRQYRAADKRAIRLEPEAVSWHECGQSRRAYRAQTRAENRVWPPPPDTSSGCARRERSRGRGGGAAG